MLPEGNGRWCRLFKPSVLEAAEWGGTWKGKAVIAIYDGEQSWGALGAQ